MCTSMVREGAGRSNIGEATDEGLLREARCSVKRSAIRLCDSETAALLARKHYAGWKRAFMMGYSLM